MPELEFGVPAQGSPPGTCVLDTLAGRVLLGGVEGAFIVEIAREREWEAVVWRPGFTDDREGVRIPARPSVKPAEELIEIMIWAAQEAHRRSDGGDPAPEAQRIGYEADDAMRCQEERRGALGIASAVCGMRRGHDGPHSWEPHIPERGDALDTCGQLGGSGPNPCFYVKDHSGPHSWESRERGSAEGPPGDEG